MFEVKTKIFLVKPLKVSSLPPYAYQYHYSLIQSGDISYGYENSSFTRSCCSSSYEEERTTAGGIVIPDTAAEKPMRGEVIAIGPGKMLDNGELRTLAVKVGDEVLFGKYSGTEVKIDGKELLVMREDDIMGVIESN